MGRTCRGGVPWLLLVALSGCHSQKAAEDPNSAAGEQGEQAAELKEDAVAATVKLAALWIVPVSSEAEKPTGWHRHEASGTCTTTGSASWLLDHEQNYGPGDESVTLLNQKLGALMTLYTY